MVAPLVGAWIEIFLSEPIDGIPTSLLSWERGLKCYWSTQYSRYFVSLLSWERGLKYVYVISINSGILVAPLVGAWIEISF